MPDVREILTRSELFKGLNDNSIDRVARQVSTLVFDKDRIICREGDAGESLYIIVSGSVAVLKDMGWGQHELRRLGADEAFGEMSLISLERRSATVKSLERTEVLTLDRAGFSSLLDQDPHFGQRIAKVVTDRLSALGDRSSSELLSAYRALMFALADLTDSRDPETGAHLLRTRSYCVLLAERLAKRARYSSSITHSFIEELYNAAPLHDIGKVAIPDAILLKPGRLSPEEFEVMKRHTTAGAGAFGKVVDQCDTDLFRMTYRICLHHHEKWDGSGYPSGLAGDDIPLEARIMAMADVYDALLSKRVYKEPMSFEDTTAELRRSAGVFFDPEMAEVMLADIGSFEAIFRQFLDVPMPATQTLSRRPERPD
jgi:response regulator RpfG family c-di-GMP phosphodiesterase